jgi:hypothetical protein
MLLGELLVMHGLATTAQVKAALRKQRTDGGHIGAHLIDMGVLTAHQLYEVLQEQTLARTSLPFCEHLVSRMAATFGADHPTTSEMRCKLARALITNGRFDEALKESQAAYESLQARYGSDHPLTIEAARVKDASHHVVHGPAAALIARLRAETQDT